MPFIDEKSRNTEVERGVTKGQMAANPRGNGTHEDNHCPKCHLT